MRGYGVCNFEIVQHVAAELHMHHFLHYTVSDMLHKGKKTSQM